MTSGAACGTRAHAGVLCCLRADPREGQLQGGRPRGPLSPRAAPAPALRRRLSRPLTERWKLVANARLAHGNENQMEPHPNSIPVFKYSLRSLASESCKSFKKRSTAQFLSTDEKEGGWIQSIEGDRSSPKTVIKYVTSLSGLPSKRLLRQNVVNC